ncbi:MAG: serpin family protein [Thermodesulfobacteriota bacterium]|nr:serpin family protein [Thermodesulfobacteriota bacterium]
MTENLRPLWAWFLAVLLVISLVACRDDGNSHGSSGAVSQGAVVQSQKDRTMAPQTNEEDGDELAEGNTAFAFDMYQTLRQQDDNLIYSPYSISLALAMTYAGARGETEQQMAETLHFTLGQNRLHPAFNALDLELAHRGEGAQGAKGEGFQLNIANAIWGQTGYSFLEVFLDTLAENYGAGLRLLDFASDPEACRLTINDWVSDRTEDKIQDLIPMNAISPLTRLVLTNAIYFNAAWNFPFDVAATQSGFFHLLDGGEVSADMMSQEEYLGYIKGWDYEAVELPYDGRELSMVIFLPVKGRFKAFEKALTADKANSMVAQLTYENVRLTMPRFSFSFGLSLTQALRAMGMPDAFNPSVADFSGMDGAFNLFISDVIHKAFIAVDEAGTEAAAATAVIMKLTAMPKEPIVVSVDRPFIFMIRDIPTKTVLFMGRVLDPEV